MNWPASMSTTAPRAAPRALPLHFACTHRYPSGFVLEAAFDLPAGVSAIFGPSGSGKSTIIALIAGMRQPVTGRIALGDRVLTDTARGIRLPPEARGVGVVFQDHLLFPHMTVRENLRFGMHRRPQRQVDFDEVVQMLGLAELLDRSAGALSGGQSQRAALGRALLRGPDLLLMDEPLSGLEAPLKARVLEFLDAFIRRHGMSAILVTHERAEVRRLAARRVVLEAGQVIRSGRGKASGEAGEGSGAEDGA